MHSLVLHHTATLQGALVQQHAEAKMVLVDFNALQSSAEDGAQRKLCRAEAVSCVPGSRRGLSLTGCSVQRWTGDSQGGSEVHCSFSSVTLSGPASKDSEEEFGEEDWEAPQHLAACPSTC